MGCRRAKGLVRDAGPSSAGDLKNRVDRDTERPNLYFEPGPNSYRVVCTSYVHRDAPMATTRVNFRLPEDLVKRADLAATVESKNRTEVVTEALVAYLEALETQERYRESLVERFLDDEVGFLALREAIGLRDAEAVRASKALLDRSEEVSGTIAGLDPE